MQKLFFCRLKLIEFLVVACQVEYRRQVVSVNFQSLNVALKRAIRLLFLTQNDSLVKPKVAGKVVLLVLSFLRGHQVCRCAREHLTLLRVLNHNVTVLGFECLMY